VLLTGQPASHDTAAHSARSTREQQPAPTPSVPTPALVVDLDRLESNLRSFQAIVAAGGKRFRPHAKAHKTPELARRQLEAGAAGIAVAKTAEAEVFVAAGCRDIVVAYPVVGEEKWVRLARLAREARLAIDIDSEIGVRGLARAASAAGASIDVLIEIDGGLERSGLPPSDLDGIERLARLVGELPSLRLRGIATYRGKSFPGGADVSNEDAGREEARLVVGVARRLRERRIAVDEVVAGSTATGGAVATADGVTEVRAGAYVFFDGAQLAAGSATADDAALTVLATVVSVRPGGTVTVDAGSKTFGASKPPGGDMPFARALDVDAAVVRLDEEHGVVALGDGVEVDVGDRLRFMPYHASAAVDHADELVGVRGGRAVEILRVEARGKRT
jgi:D-serine deaminase-like pyridoxal phosphate-dependent protein